MSAEALARVLATSGAFTASDGYTSVRILEGRDLAERILADPAPLLAALAEAGVLTEHEQALIHYRHGVNSGTLGATNTPESIAVAVQRYEQETHGPIGVERIEVRTKFTHLTPWTEVPR